MYVAGTFFLYVLAENMVQDKLFRKEYILINFSFNVLKNILLSIAMLMKEDKLATNTISNAQFSDDWEKIKSIKNLS